MRGMRTAQAWVWILAMLLSVALGAGPVLAAERVVRFWHSYTQPERVAAMKQAAADFEKQHGARVEIEIVPWPRVYEKWTTALAAGTLPDVSVAIPDNYMAMWMAEASQPVDDLVRAMGGDQAFVPGLLDRHARYQGKTICVPHYMHATILIYRKDLFDQKGLAPPVTWEDLLRVSTALTEPPARYGFQQLWSPADPIGITWTLYPLMRSNGGEFFDRNGNVIFNSPENVEAVRFMMQLQRAASSPAALELQKNKDQWDLLGAGRTAMHFDTLFSLFIVERDNPELGKKLAAWYPPKRKQAGWLATCTCLALLRGKNPEDGRKWIRFLLEDDRYIDFLHTIPSGMLPVTVSAGKAEKFWSHPFIQKHREEVKIKQEGVAQGHFTGAANGLNPYIGLVQTTKALPNMVAKMVLQNVSPERAVAEAHAELEKAVAEMRARAKR